MYFRFCDKILQPNKSSEKMLSHEKLKYNNSFIRRQGNALISKR